MRREHRCAVPVVLVLMSGALLLMSACSKSAQTDHPDRPPPKPVPITGAGTVGAVARDQGETIATVSEEIAPKATSAKPLVESHMTPGFHAVRKASVLRARPAPDGNIVAQVPQGAAVEVVRSIKNETGIWAYIKMQSDKGWVLTSAFSRR